MEEPIEDGSTSHAQHIVKRIGTSSHNFGRGWVQNVFVYFFRWGVTDSMMDLILMMCVYLAEYVLRAQATSMDILPVKLCVWRPEYSICTFLIVELNPVVKPEMALHTIQGCLFAGSSVGKCIQLASEVFVNARLNLRVCLSRAGWMCELSVAP